MDDQLKVRIMTWAQQAPEGARQLLRILESSLNIPPEDFPVFIRAHAGRLGLGVQDLERAWEDCDPHSRQCLYWYLLGCGTVVSTPNRQAVILVQVDSLRHATSLTH